MSANVNSSPCSLQVPVEGAWACNQVQLLGCLLERVITLVAGGTGTPVFYSFLLSCFSQLLSQSLSFLPFLLLAHAHSHCFLALTLLSFPFASSTLFLFLLDSCIAARRRLVWMNGYVVLLFPPIDVKQNRNSVCVCGSQTSLFKSLSLEGGSASRH